MTTSEDVNKIVEAEQENDQKFKHHVSVCVAAGCLSTHSGQVKTALEEEIKKQGLVHECQVKGVGCMGLCAAGPLVSVRESGKVYQEVRPENSADIVAGLNGQSPEPADAPKADQLSAEMPFFSRQVKIVLENCGKIDPNRIEDYIVAGGYQALATALAEMTPPQIVEEVYKSGLRGRGGAGYPTGLKWSTVSKARGNPKYVICNADEGDPGAFMDRSVLESDPHRVLEGMALAAYAVGASQGYVYVRAEYPLAIERLQNAIKQARRMRFLGNDVCGTTFAFNIDVRLGAGAFVCGEETALIASVEGGRGNPKPRPPYPAEAGLWGCPTLINNVETFANIAPIVRNGGSWYASIGTEKSKGTKVFALAGRVKNTGLIEVPMGMTLRQIVFEIGGGIPDGKRLKAVQTGGPSGGCIPEQFLDMPVDYESLNKLGSIMGSGGMIVMDETSCMVDVAKYFMEFCMSESCGKCVPCRVGTAQMHDLLAKITEGRASLDDLQMLEDLCDLVKNTSLCGLGQSAPNPILSTLRYFREEYIDHICNRTCPAGVCKLKAPMEVRA
ncbi:MAG: NADH-quinone oxidoreductase subunit NuoF [Acidobacteria bacterium]|nr:MAG: NADH-quinone oxidoreductase subunit NuoF [Acidobacteriota bacterium]